MLAKLFQSLKDKLQASRLQLRLTLLALLLREQAPQPEPDYLFLRYRSPQDE